MNKLKCINPSEIKAGDLMGYLYGDALAQISKHIAHCVYCADQVEQLRMVDVQLLAAFYRDACPTPEVLSDFCFNRLPATDKLRVASHVRNCALCTEEATSVRDLADDMPFTLLTRLRESLAQALIARPVMPLAVPVRGKGWQGRFEADDLIVTLSAQIDGLTGRVRRRDALSDADYSGQAWLLGETAATESDLPHSKIDERGRFQFAALAAGSYALLLRIGEQDVALEAVQIK